MHTNFYCQRYKTLHHTETKQHKTIKNSSDHCAILTTSVQVGQFLKVKILEKQVQNFFLDLRKMRFYTQIYIKYIYNKIHVYKINNKYI